MGPAAWRTVGRVLAVALARSFFTGPNNVVRIVARQIQKAIINNDLDLARTMMQDLALHHRKTFESFMKKYADDLPEEALKEFKSFLEN